MVDPLVLVALGALSFAPALYVRLDVALARERTRRALLSGEALAPVIVSLTKVVRSTVLARRVLSGRMGEAAARAAAEVDALIALLHLEQGAYSAAAEVQLGSRPLERAVRSRRELLRGASLPLVAFDGVLGSVGALVDADSRVQLALATGVRFTDDLMLPTTRARVLADAHHEAEGLALLETIDRTRVDASCARTPNEPLTRAWIRRASGPYR